MLCWLVKSWQGLAPALSALSSFCTAAAHTLSRVPPNACTALLLTPLPFAVYLCCVFMKPLRSVLIPGIRLQLTLMSKKQTSKVCDAAGSKQRRGGGTQLRAQGAVWVRRAGLGGARIHCCSSADWGSPILPQGWHHRKYNGQRERMLSTAAGR